MNTMKVNMKICLSKLWIVLVKPINTPDLLGISNLWISGVFFYDLFGFWLANQWIYALLPHHPIKGKNDAFLWTNPAIIWEGSTSFPWKRLWCASCFCVLGFVLMKKMRVCFLGDGIRGHPGTGVPTRLFLVLSSSIFVDCYRCIPKSRHNPVGCGSHDRNIGPARCFGRIPCCKTVWMFPQILQSQMFWA